MILHLLTDDKFADYAIDQFSKISNDSLFLFVTDDKNFKIKYIKNLNKLSIIYSKSDEYIRFFEDPTKFSAIITHGMYYPWQERILLSVPEDVKIGWVFWGAEIYGRYDLLFSFLGIYTKFTYIKKQLKWIIQGSFSKNRFFLPDKKLFKRFNYCLTDEHEEFEYVNKYTHSKMKELWYNYYSIEETLGDLINTTIKGNNILVGNSCTLENNHKEAFKLLNKFDLGNRKIIVPLSYGENWLQNILIKEGRKLFGDSFLPLTDFIERNIYNLYLASCSIVVMNQYRPQAQGNIITSLWLGAKVYLSKKSMQYDYYIRLGVHIYSIEDNLIISNKTALEPLDAKEVDFNRQILMHEYGMENMKQKIKQIVLELNN